MTISNPENTVLAQLVSDHRNLFHFLMELQHVFITPPLESDLPKTRDLVLPKLLQLRTMLEEHFRREEAGGYLEEAACKVPSIGKQADRIIQEHPALMTRLNAMIDLLSPKEITLLRWQAAHNQFAAFTREQREHERRENEIIQQGFNEDLSPFLD